MADYLRLSHRPELERGVLIAAFRGWNDGGQGASLAAGYLAKVWHATRFGDIDPEEFYDFQATRPHVSLVDGITRRIDSILRGVARERLGRSAPPGGGQGAVPRDAEQPGRHRRAALVATCMLPGGGEGTDPTA